MKKALYDINSCGLEFKGRFELYKNVGFNAVAFTNYDFHSVFKENIEEKIKYAKKIGLEVCDSHFPFEEANLLWNKETVDEYLARLTEHIEFCNKHDIKNIILHASESDNPPPPNMFCAKKFNEVIKFASLLQVNLCVENVRSIEHFIYVLENCDKSLKICFDTGHANVFCKDYKKVFKKYSNRVQSFHLNDNDGTADQHKLPASAGCTFDWKFFKQNFKAIDYATLEFFPQGQVSHEMMEEILTDAVKAIDKIIK